MASHRSRDAGVVAAITRRIDPTDPVALTNAAWFAARRGDHRAALDCARRATLLPDAPRAAFRTHDQLLSGQPGRLLLALPLALTRPAGAPGTDAAAVDDAEIEALLARGRSLLEAGNLAASLEVFDAVLLRRGTDPVALFHRGVALAKLRRYGDALHAWDEVERASPAGTLGAMSRRHADSARRLADLFAHA